jgi:hypothetical protein
MKSPFPGMDPYIEACDLWEDFHDDLIGDVKRELARALPKGYLARTRKRCYLELVEAEGKRRRALLGEDHEEKFIDVYELRPERRLVTSIEVLSPSNKRPKSVGWKKYMRKRKALLLGKANLVEIDLLRGGDRMPMLDPWPDSPYALLVARADDAPHCRVWRASFGWPLPAIPVPLAQPDQDITLDLQPLINSIYERNHYGEEIDYATALTPPLVGEEAASVEKLLRQRKEASHQSRRRGRK